MQEATRFEIYVGLTTQDGVTIPYEVALTNTIEPALFGAGYGGFSVEEITGFWNKTREQTIRITLFVTEAHQYDTDRIALACQEIAQGMNQESVLLVTDSASVNLIGQE